MDGLDVLVGRGVLEGGVAFEATVVDINTIANMGKKRLITLDVAESPDKAARIVALCGLNLAARLTERRDGIQLVVDKSVRPLKVRVQDTPNEAVTAG